MTPIETILAGRAAAMALHDGVPASAVHIQGAANQLQAELLSARDRLMAQPIAEANAPQPTVIAAAEPILDPEPEIETPAPDPEANAGDTPAGAEQP